MTLVPSTVPDTRRRQQRVHLRPARGYQMRKPGRHSSYNLELRAPGSNKWEAPAPPDAGEDFEMHLEEGWMWEGGEEVQEAAAAAWG